MLGAVLRSAVVLPLILAVVAAPRANAQGLTIQVEFVVSNTRGEPVTDLQAREILVQQDGAAQEIASMKAGSAPGGYVVTYAPKSGKPGPVTVRLFRPGAVARGPDGPAMKIRVLRPPNDLETALLAALDAGEPARELEPDAAVLRFENHPDGLHHAFVIALPLAHVRAVDEGETTRARLGFMARVKSAEGREIRRFNVDYPIEVARAERSVLEHQRVVWTSHMHVPPGRYVVEMVARDTRSGHAGVVRLPFEVDPPTTDLRMSTLAILESAQILSKVQDDIDNPLEREGKQLVPALRPQAVPVTGQRLSFFVVLYPAANATHIVDLSLEIYKDGQLLGRGPVRLPPQEPGRPLPYVGSFPVEKYQPGAYQVRLKARQGEATAEAVASFELMLPRVND